MLRICVACLCSTGILYPFKLHSRTRNYIGKAYNPKTGVYLFKARYREYWKGNRHISSVIKYQKAKSKGTFSIKEINFTKSLIAPNIFYREIQTGHLYWSKTRRVKNIIELSIQDALKSKMQSRVIVLSKNSVVDEGSHYFIKKNWKKLLKGKIMYFKLVLPSQKNDYSFTVKKKKETKRSVTFILKASGLITKFFTKAMKVTYDKKRKRIIKYQGFTNVRKNQKVIFANILFSY